MKNFWFIVIEWIRQGMKTCWYMFKFMIPISIFVRILQETGLIVYVGNALSPLMKLMGLPGEMGLVWASSMIANIYGGLIAYLQIMPNIEPLNIAQVTTLSTIILVAHTFPLELMVTKKAGAKILPMFVIRFGFGFLAGVVIFWIYKLLGAYETYPEAINTLLMGKKDPTWVEWGIGEAKNYGILFVWITGLIIILDLLKRIGAIEKINNRLEPVLRFLGIGKDVIPITVVGMTLGLAYGGGLIIKEVKQDNKLKKRDVFYALFLMSLCHSLIEDSLLMMSIGANYTGVFVFRILFALIITYLFVKITSTWSHEKMSRWFYARN